MTEQPAQWALNEAAQAVGYDHWVAACSSQCILSDPVRPCIGTNRASISAHARTLEELALKKTAKPLSEWHEDEGFVTWWKFPVEEPAWIGTPNCSDWPGYHTHWTPHPDIPEQPVAEICGEDNDAGEGKTND